MNKQQLNNTHNLLAIIDAKIAKNEPSEVLDSWIQPCGTYGCVLGDYVIKHCDVEITGDCTLEEALDTSCAHFEFKDEFGFDSGVWHEDEDGLMKYLNVIGCSLHGTLQQRRDCVYSILEQNDINLGEEL